MPGGFAAGTMGLAGWVAGASTNGFAAVWPPPDGAAASGAAGATPVLGCGAGRGTGTAAAGGGTAAGGIGMEAGGTGRSWARTAPDASMAPIASAARRPQPRAHLVATG